jgi:predicted DNA-binding ribbon-helix-helix protein
MSIAFSIPQATGHVDTRVDRTHGVAAGTDLLDVTVHDEATADVEENAGLAAWSELEFRTVHTPDARKGLRLERAFWQALTTIASWEGIKRHKLMARVLGEAVMLRLNTASAVRSFAVHAMEQEVTRLRALSEQVYSVERFQQAPVPSFAVDRNKHVVRINGEFSRFIKVLFSEAGTALTGRPIQVNLETPVSQVFAELGTSGDAGLYTMNVVVDGRVRRMRTKIIAVPPHHPRVLVGYVVS